MCITQQCSVTCIAHSERDFMVTIHSLLRNQRYSNDSASQNEQMEMTPNGI